MTIIEDFRIELKFILNRVIKERLNEDKYFKSTIRPREETMLFFPNDVQGSYKRAIRILRIKLKNMDKLISDTEIMNLLDDFIIDLKYSDEEKIMPEIDRYIVNFFKKLKDMKSERHLFVIPIMHINLSKDITIGDSILINLNENTLASLITKYSVELDYGRNFSEIVSEIVEINETSVFGIVIVNTSDEDKALELATQKIDTCLNVLRLYYFFAPFVVRDDFRRPFLKRLIHINIDRKSYGEMGRSVGLRGVHVPTLNTYSINEIKQVGFEIINNLLCKEIDELTQLQKDILTAIFWVGNAIKDEEKNIKFIKSVIALETLLIPDGGRGKRDLLSKRFTSILFAPASKDRKREVYLEMRSLYDIRNSIIHSGEGYVYEDDLNKILYWTQAIIQVLLQYSQKYTEILQIIENEFPIDETIYSEL